MRFLAAAHSLFHDHPGRFSINDLQKYERGAITSTHFANIRELVNIHLGKEVNNTKAKETRAAAAIARNFFRNPQEGTPAAYRTLLTPSAPTITVLDSDKFPHGAITPSQLDYEYDTVWFDAINCPPHIAKAYVRHFNEKYQHFFHRQQTIYLPPISGSQMSHAATHSSAFVGGLDSLHPKEMPFVSSTLWEWMAILLNMIERGAPWPTPATFAKSASLWKPNTTGKSMTDYRILTPTSVIYRMWAKVRCKQLDPLYRHWCDDGLVAAGPGLGAADAHYNLAIRFDNARVFQTQFAGGATDPSQCFDRILREQVYPLQFNQASQSTSS